MELEGIVSQYENLLGTDSGSDWPSARRHNLIETTRHKTLQYHEGWQ